MLVDRAVLDEPAPALLRLDHDPWLEGHSVAGLRWHRASRDVRIINTPWAVLIGAVYGFLPLMVLPIYVSLEKLDKRLLEASADLGADPWRTFWQVTLPLSLPGVATGSMLVFILLMGEYILPQLLGGGKVFFIGNALVDLFLQSRNWPFGAAVSIALVAIMFVTIALYMRFVLSRGDVRRAALV